MMDLLKILPIQSAGDDIIDFTETNPFGMP